MKEKIDFVIAWVDGSDPKWQADKEKYTGIKAKADDCRYRDWDLLRYWFRGVEKFAPWVNKIHFVTYGHLPEWLNVEHPKLNIVRHKDFIPKEYLPTFNSHTIELNFHRIKGLSEKFVYFNDDMLILDYVNSKDFFYNNKVCDTIILEVLKFDSLSIAFIDANNIAVLNDHFNKKDFIRNNIKVLFTPTNGLKKVIKNLLLLPFPYFTGFYNHHLSTSFFKSSYDYAWDNFYDVLDKTCRCRQRDRTNVNQWLIKDLQIVKGLVSNRKLNFGRRINIRKSNRKACISCIKNQKNKILCVNDNELLSEVDFKIINLQIHEVLENLLNEKSLFEI